MRERVGIEPAPEFVRHILTPRIFSGIEKLFPAMTRVNKAHVVMLAGEGIIGAEPARLLLQEICAMGDAGYEAIELDPRKEDLFYNLEGVIIERLGPDVGGQLHTARSRNDLYATTQRLMARDDVNKLTRLALTLRERLVGLAREHVETVMTGYTHLQPAQPISLGHYFSAIADALERDTARLNDAYRRLNLSPLGAGALATSGFPINRQVTMELLGFDGLVENSLDAVAARDYLAETLFAFTSLAITISRLAHDLHVWYSHEFAYIDITGEAANTSSIMPQKKNPGVIEHLKGKAGHLMGALVSCLACQKTVAYTNTKEAGSESPFMFGDAVAQVEAILDLSDMIVRSLIIRKDTMAMRAQKNFCTVTELADTLVRDTGLSFRTAYQVVGTLVREAVEAGIETTDQLTAEMVNGIVQRVADRPSALDENTLRNSLDPLANISTRAVQGGPAPKSVLAMLDRAEAGIRSESAALTARVDALAAADTSLSIRVEALLSR